MNTFTNIKVIITDKNVTIEMDNDNVPVLVKSINYDDVFDCDVVMQKNYVLKDEICDNDNIFNIISNYLWYRGFIGLGNGKYGRLFKELLCFDLEAKRKYGSVKTMFNMLNLDSEDGIVNLKKFILFQKTITKDFSVYHCTEIIGLCGIVVEEWKKMGRCLNWLNTNDIFKVLDVKVLEELKKFLQNKLLYEELI
ncbi:139R [Yaba monkey tumor virus]|uniref:139R n=1 Tax=Yaba monkey tumor virus (strain VR587) TaxID=928314 RepID=Q6TUN4_YMTV5|nr:hypothetical protein YMTVg139R [Yaba monkey tumor virus]AAR07492.1 139R [Yaba monkey tumor virus]